MKVLVCGSRHFNDERLMNETLSRYEIKTIIHGEAAGADTLARKYGERHGLDVLSYPALWAEYGKAAGPIRNAEMLKKKPDLVIAFWDGISPGTRNMINISREAGVEVIIIDVSQNES